LLLREGDYRFAERGRKRRQIKQIELLDTTGSAPWPMQESSKKSLCGALIPMRLNQNVDHVAILVHGTP
jgi:hypothetical protein